MPETPEDEIRKALKLEQLRRSKAVEEFNRECDAEVSKIISDQAARGILQSGITGSRIAKAHVARAEKIIDSAIKLRKAMIQEVTELAAEKYFRELLRDLERTAENVCRSIPEHIARHTGGAGSQIQPAGNREDHEATRLKAHARRE